MEWKMSIIFYKYYNEKKITEESSNTRKIKFDLRNEAKLKILGAYLLLPRQGD